ncbi:MAG: hypothetical protein HFJ25_03925 [Clostridia bacterium]|nr:hypothetical protein [Clostridia bacterium]
MLKRCMSVILTVIIILISDYPITVFAKISEKEEVNLYSTAESLPFGSYLIGNFTFKDTNLSQPRIVPSGASSMQFFFSFHKATSDTGIGDVKLTVQIRKVNGTVVYTTAVNAYSSQKASFWTEVINVKPGEQYQIWLDASSVNPAQSNGNFRSITVEMYSVVW